MTKRAGAGVAALLALVPLACAPTPASDVTVYAAASLRDAMAAVEAAYELEVPGVTITTSSDASSTLRTQIENGAPADLFLSADATNPEALVAAGLVDGQPAVFARNRLAIIVPKGNAAGVETPQDLVRPGVKIVAAGDEVPITTYANETVDRLGELTGDARAFSTAYATNIVSREDNVKAVVAKIELGEGDAAIVYATDGLASGKVDIVEIPGDANAVANYVAVVVAKSGQVTDAHRLLDWLVGPEGAAILARFGFIPPP